MNIFILVVILQQYIIKFENISFYLTIQLSNKIKLEVYLFTEGQLQWGKLNVIYKKIISVLLKLH